MNSLLDDLVQTCNVKYISDLKYVEKEMLFFHIKKLNVMDYELKEWNDLFEYLFEEEPASRFTSYEQINDILKK